MTYIETVPKTHIDLGQSYIDSSGPNQLAAKLLVATGAGPRHNEIATEKLATCTVPLPKGGKLAFTIAKVEVLSPGQFRFHIRVYCV